MPLLQLTGADFAEVTNASNATVGVYRGGSVLVTNEQLDEMDADFRALFTRVYVDAEDFPSEVASDVEIAAHAGLNTGVHGVGGSTVESAAGAQARVNAHRDDTTEVHGIADTGLIVLEADLEAAILAAGPVLEMDDATLITTSAAETDMASFTVTPGLLDVGDLLRLVGDGVMFNNTGSSNTVIWRLYVGATLALQGTATLAASGSHRRLVAEFNVRRVAAGTLRAGGSFRVAVNSSSGLAALDAATSLTGYNAAIAETLDADTVVRLTAQHSSALNTQQTEFRGSWLLHKLRS